MDFAGKPVFLPTRNLPFATVHGQFLQAAASNAHAVALMQGTESLTYSELLHRAINFASKCTAAGIAKGTLVAVDAVRSIDTVIGILGIIFVGGVYVPVSLCEETSSTLLSRHQIKFLVSARQEHLLGTDVDILSVEKDQPRRAVHFFDMLGEACDLNDPAYVLFTSGTTSARKGVVIPHRGILRLVNDQTFLSMDKNERVLLHSPFTFDASTLELWAPLLQGGTVVLAPERPLAVEDFRNLILQQDITTVWLTAGLFHLVAQHAMETFAPLRQLIVGGDVIHADLFAAVKQRYPHLRLVNGYGPTENTTFTTCYVATDDFSENKVPIGKPITGTTIFILDETGNEVPDGSLGELAAGGAGVALGYLNDPSLTAQRFPSNPSQSAENNSLYLTGDIVRRREDGQLEFLGRKDSEVKLAGQRVQLDDVELIILSCDQVSACSTVVIDEAADKFLVAFIVWRGQEAEEELRAIIRNDLPPAAIPRIIHTIKELPLTDNGKVDRAKLRNMFLQNAVQTTNPKASTNNDTHRSWLQTTERIWSTILHRKSIDTHANFFDLGGDSLSLVILQAELQKLSTNAPSLVELFSLPSVKSIADYMNAVDPPKTTKQSDCVQSSVFVGELNIAGRDL